MREALLPQQDPEPRLERPASLPGEGEAALSCRLWWNQLEGLYVTLLNLANKACLSLQLHLTQLSPSFIPWPPPSFPQCPEHATFSLATTGPLHMLVLLPGVFLPPTS